MDRKLKIIMILVWSIVAILLTALLIFGIVTGKSGGSVFSIFNWSGVKTEVQKQESISPDNLGKIIMDFSSENVVITSTEENQIRVVESCSGKLNDNSKFTVTRAGNTVNIEQGSPGIHFNIFEFGHLNRQIEIFIPKSYKNDLEVSLSSGNITINNDLSLNNFKAIQRSGNLGSRGTLTAQEVSLESTSGNITIGSLYVKSYNLEVTSGNIKIDSLSGSGGAKATSGNVNISYKDIAENSNLSSISGNVILVVPKELSFEFDGACSSGNINSNFDLSYKNKGKKQATAKVGSGSYKKINARVTSGNINISIDSK